MKKDIQNKDDIRLLVDSFYEKVKVDDKIGYFFKDVVNVDWEKHLPVMYNFWENVVFQSGSYSGNPMATHSRIHQLSPMNEQHFKRWVHIFTETVDDLFSGDNAELIKQRALSIATTMQIKILHRIPYL